MIAGHWRSGLWVLVKLAVSAGLIAWIASRFDFATAASRIAGMRPELVGLATFAVLAQYELYAWRWWLILRAIGAPLGHAPALRFTFVSFFFHQTLLPTIGIDAARIVLVARAGIPMGMAVSGVAIDRLVATFSLALLAIVAAPLLRDRLPLTGVSETLLAVGIVGAVVTASPIDFAYRIERRIARFPWLAPFRRFGEGARAVAQDRPSLFAVLGLSLAIHGLSLAILALLVVAAGSELRVFDAAILAAPVLVAASLPISFAGWGVREGTMVAIFIAAGASGADALAASIASGLLYLATSLVGAALWIADRRG
jgi:uncharacterized protein (TIRG00374 family)